MSLLRIAMLALALQQPGSGTASLEGIVVRLGSSEPISGVDIEITNTTPQSPPAGATPASPATAQPSAQPIRTAKSGSDGKFAFRNLPSGAYKLVAARIGGSFVPVEYGQKGILGRGVTFPIGDGEQKRDIKLEMAPVGTITGRVFDENQRPLGHVAVLALTPTYANGQQTLTIAELVHTDDHGEYRLFSLVPGKYYVAARPEDPTRRTAVLNVVPPGRRISSDQAVTPVVTKRILSTGETVEETYRFVYYGGSTDVKRATALNLNPGGLIGAVDIPLDAGKTRSLHVRGRVVDGSIGGPAKGANVRLIPRVYSAHKILPQVVTDANGEFDLTGVVAGNYDLYFLGTQVPQRAPAPGVPPPPPPPLLMAMIPLDIGNDDVNGLAITITAGANVSGRITIEGRPDSTAADFSRMRISLDAVPSGAGMVQSTGTSVADNGRFKVENGWPGKFQLTVSGIPPNTYVKSAQLGNLDLLAQPLPIPMSNPDGPVEILIGSDAGQINGRVEGGRGDGVSNARVVLIPDAPLRGRLDLYKNTTTDSSGNFRIGVIPPGDYKLFAWEDVEDGAWADPEFLRLDEARSKSIRVGAGRSENANVTVIPARK